MHTRGAGGAQARPGGDSNSPASGTSWLRAARCRLPRPALTSDTALVSTGAPLPSDLKRREARMVEGFLLGRREGKPGPGTPAGLSSAPGVRPASQKRQEGAGVPCGRHTPYSHLRSRRWHL